jgi:hypothetical protein
LTVVEHPQQGLFGGYLVLNLAGRPLEFHCTAPIKPSRAQQILYGPTLAPYLFGEQIGQTLLAKTRSELLAVLTDCEPALAVREHVELPVALLLSPPSECAGGERTENAEAGQAIGRHWRVDAAHAGPRLMNFAIGRHRLAVAAGFEDDRRQLELRLDHLPDSLDLAEPFGRIQEAIEEARKIGG